MSTATTSERATERVPIYCSEEQKARWVEAAAADSRSLSDWIRVQCDRAIQRSSL